MPKSIRLSRGKGQLKLKNERHNTRVEIINDGKRVVITVDSLFNLDAHVNGHYIVIKEISGGDLELSHSDSLTVETE